MSRKRHPLTVRAKFTQRLQQSRSPLILLLLLLIWCAGWGWGLAQATSLPDLRSPTAVVAMQTNRATPATIGTVDPVPDRLKLAQELYLENCASCHIAVPPAVLPTETWRQLLSDSRHYGRQLPPMIQTTRLLIWEYLQTFSRPHKAEEEVPYRVAQSRFFQALHPRVKLAPSLQLSGCITCHPGAKQYDFRSLTPDWDNAP